MLQAERAWQDRGGPGVAGLWDATGKPTDWRTLERRNPEDQAILGVVGLNTCRHGPPPRSRDVSGILH